METLIAVDPAKWGAAWALFHEGMLVGCGLEQKKQGRGEAVARLPLIPKRASVVIEVPQVYQQRHWKGDPNDLIQVALTAGMVAQYYAAHKVQFTLPHAWKGSSPKEVTERRVNLTLDERERNVIERSGVAKSLRHNVIDAVGIGLWALRREQR